MSLSRVTVVALIATSSMNASPPEPNGWHPRHDVVYAREQPPLIRRSVAPPSSDFTTYIEGELVRMGLARNDKRHLRVTTDGVIESYVLVTPSPGRTFRYRRVTISDRPGLQTVLSSVSEATGAPERIEMFTTLLRNGTLFYVLAVAPRDRFSDYEGTFRRVVGSIQIMDYD